MPHQFQSITLHNIKENSFIYLPDPPVTWKKQYDCGTNYTCTGPQHVLLKFKADNLKPVILEQGGTNISYLPSNKSFIIISKNKGSIAECILTKHINASVCKTNWGLIQFQSLDAQKYTKDLTPVTFTKINIYSSTILQQKKLNQFMDHRTQSEIEQNPKTLSRLLRFQSLVNLGQRKQLYEIKYAKDAPIKQSFKLNVGVQSKITFVIIRLGFNRADSVRLYDKSGKMIEPKAINPSMPLPSFTSFSCGENRWNAQQFAIQFVLTTQNSCQVKAKIQNSVQIQLTLNTNLQQFNRQSGQKQLPNLIAQQLGINQQRIKIIAASKNPLVVEAQIQKLNNQSQQHELQSIGEKLNKILSLGDWQVTKSFIAVRTDTGINTFTHQNQDDSEQQEKNITDVFLILILAGIVLFLIAIVVLIICLIKKRKQRTKLKIHINPTGDPHEIACEIRIATTRRTYQSESEQDGQSHRHHNNNNKTFSQPILRQKPPRKRSESRDQPEFSKLSPRYLDFQ